MNDQEYRALLEFHAAQLLNLNKEPEKGYGVIKKATIQQRIERMKALADNLDG